MSVQLLCVTSKGVTTHTVKGLTAIGGSRASGICLQDLAERDDYVIVSPIEDSLSVHTLKYKNNQTVALKAFEKIQIKDLLLVVVPRVEATENSDDQDLILKLHEVNRIVKSISTAHDLQKSLNEILLSIITALDLEKGFVAVRKLNNEFSILSSEGVSANDPWLSESLLRDTLKSSEPIFVQNVIGSAFEQNRSLVSTGFLSVFSFPLRLRSEVLGALVVGSTRPHSGLNDVLKTFSELYSYLAAHLVSLHLREESLKAQVESLRQLRQKHNVPFVTNNHKMQQLVDMAVRVCKTDLSVVIHGETGVGKEVLATWLHENSEFSQGPFVAVNCGAIPETLIESLLFGHKKGAFTGAHADQVGKLVQANNGTLFLDEIGDLPLSTQVKLLRVLQEQEVEPVGSHKAIPVKIRVLTASHKNLEAMVKEGKFREDLFFRLNEVQLDIPALRERREDISLIVSEYLRDHYSDKRLSPKAWEWLQLQEWPGNVRELLSVVKRAALLSQSHEIEVEDFNFGTRKTAQTNWLGGRSLDESMQKYLFSKVSMALEMTQNNRTRAAELLGITPRTLFRYLEDMRKSDVTDLS